MCCRDDDCSLLTSTHRKNESKRSITKFLKSPANMNYYHEEVILDPL